MMFQWIRPKNDDVHHLKNQVEAFRFAVVVFLLTTYAFAVAFIFTQKDSQEVNLVMSGALIGLGYLCFFGTSMYFFVLYWRAPQVPESPSIEKQSEEPVTHSKHE